MLMALTLAFPGAPGAAADDPPDVLLTSPATGRTTALHSTAAEYTLLRTLLDDPARADPGVAAEPGQGPRPSLEVVMGLQQIDVAWLGAERRPWMLHRVYAAEGSQPWVHTAPRVPLSYNGTWHRPARPERLMDLLSKFGLLLPPARSDQDGEPVVAGSPPPSPVTSGGPPSARSATGGRLPDGWWWALPGAGLGALAAALFLRHRAGRRGGSGDQDPPGPRGRLIDL
ncbi:hypothetical protein [Streptomyces sp. NPDC051561]|uniref:hypothetical protein n=1 Tax=Streptomyces sp. NPDC051561 TaxID=3365658 RepID=UPI0037B36A35